jgi:hypothetical protein
MNIKYPVDIKVVLSPLWFERFPDCKIGVNGQLQTVTLSHTESFTFKLDDPQDGCVLEIHHINKQLTDTDLVNNRDTAILIDEITINNISSPKFVWLGKYCPEYPEHYVQEQTDLGVELSRELTNTNYLGWNGVWRLSISIPAFVWIHRVNSLGWIYN